MSDAVRHPSSQAGDSEVERKIDAILWRLHQLPIEEDIRNVFDNKPTDVLDIAGACRAIQALIVQAEKRGQREELELLEGWHRYNHAVDCLCYMNIADRLAALDKVNNHEEKKIIGSFGKEKEPELPHRVYIPSSLSDDEINLGDVAETLNKLIEYLEARDEQM